MKQKVGLPVPKGPKTANLYKIGAEVTNNNRLVPSCQAAISTRKCVLGGGGLSKPVPIYVGNKNINI